MIKNVLISAFVLAAVLSGLNSAIAQTANTDSSKTVLVGQLLELTAHFFPKTDPAASLNPKKTKEIEDKENRDRLGFLTLSLKENQTLTAEQKAFAEANLDKLGAILKQRESEIIARHEMVPKIDGWIKESLESDFEKYLTKAELTQLIAFFSANGKDVAPAVNSSSPSAPDQKAAKQQNQRTAFAKTPLGKKFFKLLLENTKEYLNVKIEDSGAKLVDDLQNLFGAEVNVIINEFVAQNYKK